MFYVWEYVTNPESLRLLLYVLLLDQLHYALCLGVYYKSRKSVRLLLYTFLLDQLQYVLCLGVYYKSPKSVRLLLYIILADQLHYVLCLEVYYKSRKSSTTPPCIITRPATLCFMSGSILQIPKVYSSMHYY